MLFPGMQEPMNMWQQAAEQQHGQAHTRTQHGSISHTCSRFCQFTHEFGNLWKCSTSGSTHICDSTCDQRIFYDNHSTICRLSKRIFPNGNDSNGTSMAVDAPRKRCADEAADSGSKRRVLGVQNFGEAPATGLPLPTVIDPSSSSSTWLTAAHTCRAFQ